MSEYTYRKFTFDSCLEPADKEILTKSQFRVFRDRPLITPGTYTDGLQRTKARFKPEVLQRDATNWEQNLVDLDHRIDDMVRIAGHVKPKGYSKNAVRGDVYLHKGLLAGKTAIALIDAEYVKGLSVETLTRESWDKDEQLYDVEEVVFVGLGIVGTPACPDASIVD